MKKKTLKLPSILQKAEEALREAVAGALLEHKQKGLPIFVWQDNKVVRIPPRRIRVR